MKLFLYLFYKNMRRLINILLIQQEIIEIHIYFILTQNESYKLSGKLLWRKFEQMRLTFNTTVFSQHGKST